MSSEECAASSSPSAVVDVAIVGGGLSGLVLAAGLKDKCSWLLLEAHPELLGGRIRNSHDGIDLGPAWVWRGQRNVESLIRDYKVTTFAQPDDPGSTRIAGGAYAFIKELHNSLDPTRIRMGFPVVSCARENDRIVLTSAKGEIVHARHVALTAPPKLLSERVKFSPDLSMSKVRAMANSETWMAGVTKVALAFRERFWPFQVSNMGFPPGGPAFQVYDGSTHRDATVCLTFFTIAPPGVDDEGLAKACAGQMAGIWRRYGLADIADRLEKEASAAKPSAIQRWPAEQHISNDPRPTRVLPHPQPVEALSTPEWDGTLYLAGTERDRESPGVMEGAVGAARRVLAALLKRL
jgi:monoamine oxidase